MSDQLFKRFAHDDLHSYCIEVLTTLGVQPDDAVTVASCLLFADVRGHGSHGVVRLPVYGKRLVAGAVNSRGRPSVVNEYGATLLIDGDNALGPVTAKFGMEQAIRVASSMGVCLATIRNSNHFGSAAFYTERARKDGLIAMVCSNAPPNMVPWGGRERFLGTNPLAVSVPTSSEEAPVLDMATSVVARGKIILAAAEGRSIPEGWALDREGNPTTDAAEGLEGAVLPFGGPKGSAISLLIDVLAGVLSGAEFGQGHGSLENLHRSQNLGHAILVIDPEPFIGKTVFTGRMDKLMCALQASPPARGFQAVLPPGAIERTNERASRKLGVLLESTVVDEVLAFGSSLGVYRSILPVNISEELNT